MIKVENEKNLVRDERTAAIINTDDRAYKQYVAEKTRLLSEKQRINILETKVSNIESMLQKILEKVSQ